MKSIGVEANFNDEHRPGKYSSVPYQNEKQLVSVSSLIFPPIMLDVNQRLSYDTMAEPSPNNNSQNQNILQEENEAPDEYPVEENLTNYALRTNDSMAS